MEGVLEKPPFQTESPKRKRLGAMGLEALIVASQQALS